MKILVTGGAGFIGHNVVRILESHGHVCTVIDNFTNYGFIPEKELCFLTQYRLTRINSVVKTADIRNYLHINAIFEETKPDIVIHLASFPRQKVVNQNPTVASEVMSTGLINLLECSKRFSVSRFVYISSSMVYGDFVDDHLTEDAPTNPIGQYGIMKLAGEWLTKDYARQTGMEYTVIRPSAVYGEWDVEDRVVSKFMTMALRGETLKVNGANEVLDFTYVEDAAMGIAQAAVSEAAANNTYNITRSNPTQYTLLDAANIAVKLAGRGNITVADRDLDFPKRGRLSIDRAAKDFGYTPTVDVTKGFEKYLKWYNENPILWSR